MTSAANQEKRTVDPRTAVGARLNEGRFIFHSDLNNFYASVECALNPALRGHPVAVCGSCESRHGIILAKNNLAKSYGVKTAEVIWQAKQKCPGLVLVEADYSRYAKYSRLAREIYESYTDKVEPFGADEAWLDITGHPRVHSFEEARLLADEIRDRIFNELGLTVSVGVSYNKIFAKLASDYKKPDATTVFDPEAYGEIIAKLPASDMIYVGKSTEAALARYGIRTIGDVASRNPEFMRSVFGKNGLCLLRNARGEDTSPVSCEESEAKSVGNSCTPPRDLVSPDDAKAMCYTLSETVASRLRKKHLKCRTVQLSIRESDLKTHEHQCRLKSPTSSAAVIARCAFELFSSVYDWHKAVRSIGVRGTDLAGDSAPVQLSVFEEENEALERLGRLDSAVDSIRCRFGYTALQRGIVMCDETLTGALVKRRRESFVQ